MKNFSFGDRGRYDAALLASKDPLENGMLSSGGMTMVLCGNNVMARVGT